MCRRTSECLGRRNSSAVRVGSHGPDRSRAFLPQPYLPIPCRRCRCPSSRQANGKRRDHGSSASCSRWRTSDPNANHSASSRTALSDLAIDAKLGSASAGWPDPRPAPWSSGGAAARAAGFPQGTGKFARRRRPHRPSEGTALRPAEPSEFSTEARRRLPQGSRRCTRPGYRPRSRGPAD